MHLVYSLLGYLRTCLVLMFLVLENDLSFIITVKNQNIQVLTYYQSLLEIQDVHYQTLKPPRYRKGATVFCFCDFIFRGYKFTLD